MSLYPRHSYPSKWLQGPWRKLGRYILLATQELARSHLRGTSASSQLKGSAAMNCLRSIDWVGTVTITVGTKGSGFVRLRNILQAVHLFYSQGHHGQLGTLQNPYRSKHSDCHSLMSMMFLVIKRCLWPLLLRTPALPLKYGEEARLGVGPWYSWPMGSSQHRAGRGTLIQNPQCPQRMCPLGLHRGCSEAGILPITHDKSISHFFPPACWDSFYIISGMCQHLNLTEWSQSLSPGFS